MKRVETKPPAPQAPETPRPPILYVEDEDENWLVTELRLRHRYDLVRAVTDQEACRLVRERGQELYAVLMDIQLKGSELDGIQLCRVFKGKLAGQQLPRFARDCPTIQAPIFFVTAYGARFSEADLKACGGHALITKPVDFIRLNLALASANAQNAIDLLGPRQPPG